MSAANIDNSERLQRMASALAGGWRTTAELQEITKSCAVHTDIDELRNPRNGFIVEKRFEGVVNGRRVWAYRAAG